MLLVAVIFPETLKFFTLEVIFWSGTRSHELLLRKLEVRVVFVIWFWLVLLLFRSLVQQLVEQTLWIKNTLRPHRFLVMLLTDKMSGLRNIDFRYHIQLANRCLSMLVKPAIGLLFDSLRLLIFYFGCCNLHRITRLLIESFGEHGFLSTWWNNFLL